MKPLVIDDVFRSPSSFTIPRSLEPSAHFDDGSMGGEFPFRAETKSGIMIDLGNPDPQSIRLSDIVDGLQRIPRFTGQTNLGIDYNYNVLNHSVLTAMIAKNLVTQSDRNPDASLQLFADQNQTETFIRDNGLFPTLPVNENLALTVEFYALTHDAHEAYTGDISTPLKRLIGLEIMKRISDNLDRAIFDYFGVPALHEQAYWIQEIVKKADHTALVIEASRILRSNGAWTGETIDPEQSRLYLEALTKMIEESERLPPSEQWAYSFFPKQIVKLVRKCHSRYFTSFFR